MPIDEEPESVVPKEQINRPRWTKTYRGLKALAKASAEHGDTADAFGSIDPTLFVRWNPVGNDHDGHIQLSLVGYPDVAWSEFDDSRESPQAWPAPTEHYSAVLSRSEINHLIKVLKRARDGAYGRDE